MQVTTKNIKKEDRLCMKLTVPKALCTKGIFQIQPPISGANFSNNISIPQFRVNMKEIEHDKTFETYELLTSRINPSIIL